MSSPHTDRFGYPLTAAQVAARANNPKTRGYYDSRGVWHQLRKTAKRTPVSKPVTETDNTQGTNT